MRPLFLLLLTGGCTSYGIVGIEDPESTELTGETGSTFDPTGSGLTDPPTDSEETDTDPGTDTEPGDTEPDYSEFDGADLRITIPSSGDFLSWDEPHTYKAELRSADGSLLSYEEIYWSSDADAVWYNVGETFVDESIDVGLHNLTAEAELPNGDRVAHTIGGVLVQSEYAGTYSGLFNSDVTYDGLAVGCSGVANLVVEPYGELAIGDGTCLVDLLGYEVELAYLFELENFEGELVGTAAVDIFGWFEYAFDAEGFIDPSEDYMEFDFFGDVDIVQIDGGVGADRVSLDAGL